jgi:hypothetical protein
MPKMATKNYFFLVCVLNRNKTEQQQQQLYMVNWAPIYAQFNQKQICVWVF